MKSYAAFADRSARSNRSGIRAMSVYARAAPAGDSRSATEGCTAGERCSGVTCERCSLAACRCDANTGVTMRMIHEHVRRRTLRTALLLRRAPLSRSAPLPSSAISEHRRLVCVDGAADSCPSNYKLVFFDARTSSTKAKARILMTDITALRAIWLLWALGHPLRRLTKLPATPQSALHGGGGT